MKIFFVSAVDDIYCKDFCHKVIGLHRQKKQFRAVATWTYFGDNSHLAEPKI
jgi:hypothetical protein